MPRSRPQHRLLRSLTAGALAIVMVVGILPLPAAAAPPAMDEADATSAAGSVAAGALLRTPVDPASDADPVDPPSAEGGPAQRPSSMYEAWVDHKDDKISFTPGGRVTVGFRPRKDDSWQVGGSAPVALPAGIETGKAMAKEKNGELMAPGWRPARRGDGPARGTADGPATRPAPAPVDAPSNRLSVMATPVSLLEQAPVADADLAAASGPRRQVFGFLPYWEVNGAASRLNYDVLSTIAYFSVGVNGNGTLKKRNPSGTLTTGWGGWTSSSMTRVINKAHADGTRVVLTVTAFAWTKSQANVQRAILGSRSARATLARQIVAAVRNRGADGVNLDFEPLARGYESEFVALLRTIRSEFNKVRAGYQVTYDTTAYIGNYPLEASVGRRAADAIFIMGYDYRIGSASRSGSISPLSGPGYDLADTVRAYKRRVPGSRLILGIPWYGRAWSTATASPRSKTLTGAKYGYSAAVSYENAVAFARKHGRKWDTVEQSPYVAYRRKNCTKAYGCVTSWRQIWYEDATSMKRRYALVNDYNLRGAGMWALGYEGDRKELYKAVSQTLLVAHAAPTARFRSLPTTPADEGFIVSWAGSGFSKIASYDVEVSTNGGPWRAWMSRTGKTSEVFQGRNGVRYGFRVRARDTLGQVGPFASGSATVRAGIRGFNFGSGSSSGVGTSDAQLAVRAFSPNRDGSEDRLRLRWANTVPMSSMVVRVRRLDGSLIGTRRLGARGTGAQAWTWDGVVNGRRLRDGRYLLQLVGTRGDRTYTAPSTRPATTAQIASYAVRIDTRRPAVSSASGTNQVISPNGDKLRDDTRLTLAASGGAVRWTVRVANAKGTIVRSQAGAGASVTYTWRGTDGRGRRVPDGHYAIQVSLYDAAGNVVSRTASVTVDTRAPKVVAAATPRAFSPNGDGLLDATTLGWSSAERVTGTVRLSKGSTVVRSWRVSNAASWSAAWNGRRPGGARVVDGTYALRVDVRDAAGNRRVATAKILLDRTLKGLAWSGNFTPQDADALKPTSRLAWTLTRDARTTLRITDATGRVVRTAWSGRTLADGGRGWTWNGKSDSGSFVPQGRYLATLRVRSSVGIVVYSKWVWASAFTIRPNRTVVKHGQTLSVRIRSIEPLSRTPRVTFRQPGRDPVTITAQALPDGSWRASFRVRSGGRGTATIRVVSSDRAGGVNATSITVRVK